MKKAPNPPLPKSGKPAAPPGPLELVGYNPATGEAMLSDGTVITSPDLSTWSTRAADEPPPPCPLRSQAALEKDERRIGHLAAQASAYIDETSGRLREILTEIDSILDRWA